MKKLIHILVMSLFVIISGCDMNEPLFEDKPPAQDGSGTVEPPPAAGALSYDSPVLPAIADRVLYSVPEGYTPYNASYVWDALGPLYYKTQADPVDVGQVQIISYGLRFDRTLNAISAVAVANDIVNKLSTAFPTRTGTTIVPVIRTSTATTSAEYLLKLSSPTPSGGVNMRLDDVVTGIAGIFSTNIPPLIYGSDGTLTGITRMPAPGTEFAIKLTVYSEPAASDNGGRGFATVLLSVAPQALICQTDCGDFSADTTGIFAFSALSRLIFE